MRSESRRGAVAHGRDGRVSGRSCVVLACSRELARSLLRSSLCLSVVRVPECAARVAVAGCSSAASALLRVAESLGQPRALDLQRHRSFVAEVQTWDDSGRGHSSGRDGHSTRRKRRREEGGTKTHTRNDTTRRPTHSKAAGKGRHATALTASCDNFATRGDNGQ